MADSFRVGVGDVAPVPGLGPDQGWVGMTVQFLVDAAGAGAEHVVFGRALFAPGHAEHQWHRHPGAEEFALIVRDQGIVLDGDNEIPVSAVTSCSTARAPGTGSATPPARRRRR